MLTNCRFLGACVHKHACFGEQVTLCLCKTCAFLYLDENPLMVK